jgi:adenosine deaminase
MTGLADLHVHLPGARRAPDLLRYLAGQDRLRWGWYEGHYLAAYGRRPTTRQLVERYRAGDPTAEPAFAVDATFADADAGNFARASAKAKLRFLAQTTDDPVEVLADEALADEFLQLARSVRADLSREGVAYCEVRTSPRAALAEEFARADGPVMRLAVSLPRADPWPMWDHVKRLALGPHGAVVTGVDFCGVEEGHPPKQQEAFFAAVAEFNRAHPDRALAVLYHVGESFTDKTLESAIRWVHEAADAGAHRLGHAIALGIDPRVFGPHVRTESPAERRDQIAYDIAHAKGLRDAGVAVDVDALLAERTRLDRSPDRAVTVAYGDHRLAEVRRRQDYALAGVARTGAVIEVCPTSNRRIGNIGNPAAHPVHRFLRSGVPVVVATDNAGLFDITLAGELDWVCRHAGGGSDLRQRLVDTAWASRSEVLTGRQR